MLVFFIKQKTEYEMRISDWSSDVCSSDLEEVVKVLHRQLWFPLQRESIVDGWYKVEGRTPRGERKDARDDDGRSHEVEIKAACLTIVTHLAGKDTINKLTECGAVQSVYATIQQWEQAQKSKKPPSPKMGKATVGERMCKN